MKTRFLKAFAAVMMLFSFYGFVRAEDGLAITATIQNAGENVTLSQIENNACSASDVVLGDNTTLTLLCEGADEIYYTTDGTTDPSKPAEPTAKEGAASVLYADPIALNQAMVVDGKIIVKAIAYKQEVAEGAKATANVSDILTITLILKEEEPAPVETVATPTFKIGEETVSGIIAFANDTVVKIECTTSDAVVRYTLAADVDLTDETSGEEYNTTDGVRIDAACTLKARAFKTGMTASEVASISFTKKEAPVVDQSATPTFKADGQTVTEKWEMEEKAMITIEAAEGATIRYTTDADVVLSETTGMEYNAPFEVSEPCTVKAVAIETGKSISEVALLQIVLKSVDPQPEKPAVPGFEKKEGVESDTIVVLKGEADSLFVAVGRDSISAVAAGFAKYTKNVKVAVDQDTVVVAYTKKGELVSDTVKYVYKKSVDPQPEKPATPEFSLKGEVNVGDTLKISCATETAEVFYSLDTNAFVKYETGIVITRAIKVRAYAVNGELVSDTAEVSLTVKPVANENEELAGVSVYPNPNNGRFNVSVPVNAVIEVFAANGRMVKRADLSAGMNTMQLDNTGIYFVRVRANGQVSIKKVVVR